MKKIQTISDAQVISRGLSLLSQAARKQFDSELEGIVSLLESKDHLKRALYYMAAQERFIELVNKYGQAAQALAYEALEAQGVRLKSVKNIGETLDAKSITMQAMKSPNGGRGYLAGAMDNAIKRGYRQAIADNAELWARVPSGGYTCPWCVMLASRGFVYRSKASAGGMHRFHAFCDCIAVPAKDLNSAHLDGYDPDKLYELYQKGEGIGTQPRKKMAYGTDGRDITSTGVKPMTREAAAKGTNPDYAKSDAFKLNCGNCSATYEMRRRGFDVEAKPMRGMRIGDWKVLFEKAVTHQFVPERGKTILEALSLQITRLYESGARGSVFVQWKGRKMGHFFSWEIENGVVKYIDSQNGLLDVSDYFTKVRPDSILHARWDNLEPSNKGKDAYTDKG